MTDKIVVDRADLEDLLDGGALLKSLAAGDRIAKLLKTTEPPRCTFHNRSGDRCMLPAGHHAFAGYCSEEPGHPIHHEHHASDPTYWRTP